jgi:hypothetical protein
MYKRYKNILNDKKADNVRKIQRCGAFVKPVTVENQ